MTSIAYFAFICFIVLAFFVVRRVSSKLNEHPEMMRYNEIKDYAFWFHHVNGIDKLKQLDLVLVAFMDDKIILNRDKSKLDIEIPISSIIYLNLTSESNQGQNKSVIGRGIAGGLIAGGAGAVVGGLSGLQGGQQKYHLTIVQEVEGAEKTFIFTSSKDANYERGLIPLYENVARKIK